MKENSKTSNFFVAPKIKRKITRTVNVGGVIIGGGSPVSVQTMTNTKTHDVKKTLEQIAKCREAGADLVRVAVNDKDAADSIGEIVKKARLPIIADIHFNHQFALKSIEAGVSKVRLNPGNIGSKERIRQVLIAAKERSIPIRIGVNSGSLEKDLLEKYGYPSPEALYESAVRHIEIAGGFGFDDIVIAVKSSNVNLMILAYRMISERTDFPLHLGVTEAGTLRSGTIKSAVGIGALLSEGIGDTIRVSLTDEPSEEVHVGKDILRSLGLTQSHAELISCPTCARLETNLIELSKKLDIALRDIKKPIRVALMGCAVNGPGEAKEADIGIACGKDSAVIYIDGVKSRKVSESDILEEVMKEIENYNIENPSKVT